MYSSSLVGLQSEAAIAGIESALEKEINENGLDYMLEIDDLLDRRHRLMTAVSQAHVSGELPIADETDDGGTEIHNPEGLGL